MQEENLFKEWTFVEKVTQWLNIPFTGEETEAFRGELCSHSTLWTQGHT